MLSMMLSIIDWGQYEFDNDPVVRVVQYTSTGPDKEYLLMPKFFARFIHLLRASIGDNNYDASTYLIGYQNHLYWIIFMLANGLLTIVFMNFIIAEVGNSYNVIMESLHQKLLKQRGLMINEAEDICRSRYTS